MDCAPLFHVLHKLQTTECGEQETSAACHEVAPLAGPCHPALLPEAEGSPLRARFCLEAADERESALGDRLLSVAGRLWFEEFGVSGALNVGVWPELAFGRSELQGRGVAVAEMDRAIGEKNRAIAEKDRALAQQGRAIAEKDMAIAERDRVIAEKDRAILVLEQDKEAFKEEMIFVIKGSITILQSVSEQVLDLTVALQRFKLQNVDEEMATIPIAPTSSQEMQATTLLSCGEEVSRRIHYAQCALDEAFKRWKKAEAGLEILQNFNRKFLLAKILGKEEATPISDAGQETTTGLHQMDRI